MKWTVAKHDRVCGGCSQLQPVGEPIVLVTAYQRVRCVRCAERMGFELDLAAVAAATAALVDERTRPLALPLQTVEPRPAAPRFPHSNRPSRRSWSATRPETAVFDPRAAQFRDDS